MSKASTSTIGGMAGGRATGSSNGAVGGEGKGVGHGSDDDDDDDDDGDEHDAALEARAKQWRRRRRSAGDAMELSRALTKAGLFSNVGPNLEAMTRDDSIGSDEMGVHGDGGIHRSGNSGAIGRSAMMSGAVDSASDLVARVPTGSTTASYDAAVAPVQVSPASQGALAQWKLAGSAREQLLNDEMGAGLGSIRPGPPAGPKPPKKRRASDGSNLRSALQLTATAAGETGAEGGKRAHRPTMSPENLAALGAQLVSLRRKAKRMKRKRPKGRRSSINTRRKHPRVADIVLQAWEANKVACSPAAICCPCYMCTSPPVRVCIRATVSSLPYIIFNILTVVWVLVAGDLLAAFLPKRWDPYFEAVFFVAFLAFLVDIVLASSLDRRVVYGFFWWLDVLAMLSLIFELPTLSRAIFGQDLSAVEGQDASVGAFTQGLRGATRVGRFVRIFRLFKLSRKVQGPEWMRKMAGVDDDEGEEGGSESEYSDDDSDIGSDEDIGTIAEVASDVGMLALDVMPPSSGEQKGGFSRHMLAKG